MNLYNITEPLYVNEIIAAKMSGDFKGFSKLLEFAVS